MLANYALRVVSRRRAPSLCIYLLQLQLTIFSVSEDSAEQTQCT